MALVLGHPPGDATARREAEIPVAEDREARRAAKATVRHALPVRFEFFKWPQFQMSDLNQISMI